MAKYYAVITTGSKEQIRRSARTGDSFARVEIATERGTFRFEVGGEGDAPPILTYAPHRWRVADALPTTDWDVLWEGEEQEEAVA